MAGGTTIGGSSRHSQTLPGRSETLANNCLPRLDAPRARRPRSGNADPCAVPYHSPDSYVYAYFYTYPDAFTNPNTVPHPNTDPYLYAYFYTCPDAFTNPNTVPHPNTDPYLYAYFYTCPDAFTNPNTVPHPNPDPYVHPYSYTHPETHVGTNPPAYSHRNSTARCSRDVDQSCPGRVHGP